MQLSHLHSTCGESFGLYRYIYVVNVDEFMKSSLDSQRKGADTINCLAVTLCTQIHTHKRCSYLPLCNKIDENPCTCTPYSTRVIRNDQSSISGDLYLAEIVMP